MSSLHSEKWLQNRQFGIVIDAGSSGSRIHIYSWINRQHLNNTAPAHEFVGVLPTIEPGVESGSPNSSDWTLKTEPGIADFKERPEDVGEHLEPLLDHAQRVIPESEIPNTPIYLLATAGLRLVQDDIREQILANSCKYVKENYQFMIGDCEKHIKNITGEEEGIYGWVAINYLMGGFDNGGVKMIDSELPGSEQHNTDDSEPVPPLDPHDASKNNAASHRHTLGFLDMGGASTQIAFEPSPKASEDHANDLTNVILNTLDGQKLEYHVFVTTFLGYGSNQARRRYVKDYLLSNNKDLLETQKPGVQISIMDPCLPKHLQLNETHTLPHVPLTGSGSFAECLKRVEVLLNKDKECSDVPCLFNGVHTPPIDFNINTFIGVSEYWYSSHDILGLGGAYDYAEFEKKSAEFCNSEWSDILSRPEYHGQSEDRLEMQCFKSAWLSNVLHGGFGLPRYGEKGAIGSEEQSNEVLEKAEESIKNKNWRPPFQSINAIKDIQVTWTLGAMLLISSGSMGPSDSADSTGAHGHDGERHRPSQILPPPDHEAPHEDSYPERMLDSYNHFMLLAIALLALAIFWVYRSRSSKSWPALKKFLLPTSSSSPGGSNNDNGGSGGGFPLFGRFRRSGGISGADYSALESGTVGGSGGSFGRGFSPRASLSVAYFNVVHRTRTALRSLVSRVWPEPANFNSLNEGQEGLVGISIGGYDGNSNGAVALPMSAVSGGVGLGVHVPGGNFAASGLSAIPETGGGHPTGVFDPGFHRSHSNPPAAGSSGGSSRPPRTIPSFLRTKKRMSGDSQSIFGNKDKRGHHGAGAGGCVVSTALPQKQDQNFVELTARSGSTTSLLNMWSSNNNSSNNVGSLSPNINNNSPNYNNNNNSNNTLQVPGTGSVDQSGWKQGWIPEEEYEDPPIPSLLTTSRSYNTVSHSSGTSPLLTPMARYKQQQLVHQDGSTSAPSSTLNLASAMSGNGNGGGGFASGFVTSADERDEWSADNDDGYEDGDEGDGYQESSFYHQHHRQSYSRTGGNANNNTSNTVIHQYSQNPVRSSSAIPFSSSKPSTGTFSSSPTPKLTHSQSNHTVPSRSQTPQNQYKQRSTGILSGINFENGGGAMTTLDDNESASEGGYLSGSSSAGGGGNGRHNNNNRPAGSSIHTATGLLQGGAKIGGSRSVSPMMFNQQQNNSTSTSSLVLGRHNVSEQDQQLVSRGSSENVRRSSMGTIMSP
ncbi:Golgi apyrase [Mortierella sp. AD011]|nr:Golgi apyrase [Mortierella sp. AD010]KAF9386170.1 Golgi apyrase [Mortierella sp. AD011]